MKPQGPVAVTAILCFAQVATMLGNSSFPALLPQFVRIWELSNAEAGWVSGVYYAGYAVGVILLVTLTDRIDAWRIYIGSSLLGALSLTGFALLAEGFWTASLFQSLAGFALAGTYMVGLRLLSDRVTGPRQSRAIAFYTAHFSIGSAVSVFLTGELARAFGWQGAFLGAALGGLTAATVVALLIRPLGHPTSGAMSLSQLFSLKPVLRNRPAMAYILGYAGHCWELFGVRSWMVAFLALAGGAELAADDPLSPTRVAGLILMLALPASIAGNEIAMRTNRRRLIAVVQTISASLCLIVGYSAQMPYLYVLALFCFHHVWINADSASLTAGTVGASAAERKGVTMALHSLLGFAMGALSPLIFGLVLDGGAWAGVSGTLSWGLAFAVLGLGPALGVAAMLSRRLA